MMFARFIKSSLVAVFLVSGSLNWFDGSAIAQTSKNEDDFDRAMGWAGSGWPLNATVNIQDSLVGAALGKVVIDRHGEDPSGGLFKDPFAGPKPGRLVIVTLWGSKIEGCFVKTIFQYSPANGQADLKELVPVRLELGVEGQILQLTPSPTAKPRGFRTNYTYTEYQNKSSVQRSGTWYMTEILFAVNASAANLLRNAPPKEIRARLTFADGDSKLFLIGEGTVKKWTQTYGFNPSCSSPR